MKRIWIYNKFGTVLLVLLALIIDRFWYGSGIEFWGNVIILALLTVMLILSLIYGIVQVSRHTLDVGTAFQLGFSVFLMVLAILFIFNGSFWDTDTGRFITLRTFSK